MNCPSHYSLYVPYVGIGECIPLRFPPDHHHLLDWPDCFLEITCCKGTSLWPVRQSHLQGGPRPPALQDVRRSAPRPRLSLCGARSARSAAAARPSGPSRFCRVRGRMIRGKRHASPALRHSSGSIRRKCAMPPHGKRRSSGICHGTPCRSIIHAANPS